MKKYTKLTVVLLTLCMLAVGMLTACGDTPPAGDDPNEYSVTVTLDTGAPAKGVRVDIKDNNGKLSTFKTTGSNGKAVFPTITDGYTVELSNIPDGYELPQDVDWTITATHRQIKVQLVRAFAYRVHLVDEQGNPFYAEGVQVGICTLAGNCLAPVDLGKDGSVAISAEKTDYHVKIFDLPDGYTYEQDDDNYYTGDVFSATENEMTITIYAVNVLTATSDVMTTQKKTEFAAKCEAYNNADMLGRDAQYVNIPLQAGEIAYYAISSSLGGVYRLFAVSTADPNDTFPTEKAKFVDEGKLHAHNANGHYIYDAVTGHEFTVTKNEVYRFKLVASENVTTEFILVAPIASYTAVAGGSPSVTVTLTKENARGVIAFTPTELGVYKATAQGATKTLVSASTLSFSDTESNTNASAYTAGNSAHAAYTSAQETLYFAVSATGVQFPATVTVKIEKSAKIVNKTATVQSTLEQFGDQQGVLTGVPISESGYSELVKGSDGYYHYGAQNGPFVVVNLTKNLGADRLNTTPALAYMEMTSTHLASYVLDTTTGDKTNPATDIEFTDYRTFLRGFVEYTSKTEGHGSVLSIPTTITTQTYYTKYVNKDGVYPLNDELKDFLQAFYAANQGNLAGSIAGDADYKWLFPCYYYNVNAQIDQAVGTYDLVSFTAVIDNQVQTFTVGDTYSESTVSATDRLFVIDADGTYAYKTHSATLSNYVTENSGEWSKDGATYTFTSDDSDNGFKSIVYNAESKTVTVTFTDENGYDLVTVLQFAPDAE